MALMTKDSNIYAEFERIAAMLKASGSNLTAKAVASAIVNSVLADALDEAAKAKVNIEGLSWIMEDEQKGLRGKMVERVSPFITAAKNSQSSQLARVGLMPEAKGTERETVEFV